MHAGPAALGFTGGFLIYAGLTGQVLQIPAQWDASKSAPSLDRVLTLPRSVRMAGAGAVVALLDLAGFGGAANGLALLILLILIMNLARGAFGSKSVSVSGTPSQAIT